MHYLKKKIPTG